MLRVSAPRLFQSAPSAQAGRNADCLCNRLIAARFQSAPSAQAGRNALRRRPRTTSHEFQSAPSAQAGRNPFRFVYPSRFAGFNPLPALRLGGTSLLQRSIGSSPVSIRSQRSGWEELAFAVEVLLEERVSIRSQRSGWEERHDYLAPWGLRWCFNPLPALRLGGTASIALWWHTMQFQSAPSAQAGRNGDPSPAQRTGPGFQSAPSAQAGRNATRGRRNDRDPEFQSAPSAQAGRNVSYSYNDCRWPVSIRSRRSGWEERSRAGLRLPHTCFNPLPALRLGGTSKPISCGRCTEVSIRSQRSGWEELDAKEYNDLVTAKFQSAPSAQAGRNAGGGGRAGGAEMFQSAPSAQAGRNEIVPRDGRLIAVSIRSQRSGREELDCRMSARESCLFQSAPGAQAGRNSSPASERRLIQVSIRSRRSGRKEHFSSSSLIACQWFQSAPGAQAGRNSPRARRRGPTPGFNPLPALRPGGTIATLKSDLDALVSIRSRRSGREEQVPSRTRTGTSRFQSAPGAQAGRNRDLRRTARYRTGSFNPLPALRPGGTAPWKVASVHVSIRSRHQAGRNSCSVEPAQPASSCFNPLPALRPGGTRVIAAADVHRCQFQSAPGAQAGRNVA